MYAEVCLASVVLKDKTVLVGAEKYRDKNGIVGNIFSILSKTLKTICFF